MNFITLDFGNTHAHAAFFRQGELKEFGLASEVSAWLKKHDLTVGEVQGILSQVKTHESVSADLEQQGLIIERVKDYWRGQKFAGMSVNYATTLGEDRLIQAYWAHKNLPGATLLLDAGTFFTLDVVSNGFEGGYILPGLKLLNEDLNAGEQLSQTHFGELSRDLLTVQDLPHDTKTALTGTAIAYGALIQKTLIRYAPAQVVVSGGDSAIVASWLKILAPSLPLQLRPDLVHWALLDWYQRNIHV